MNSTPSPGPDPDGMVWIPGGTFWMGCDDCDMPDTRPVHLVNVDGFWMDRTPVTNAQFAQFVAATGYIMIAERKPDPKDYPGVDARSLVAGSAVFTPPSSDVPLDDVTQWWRYVPGASWKHPEGPGSTIEGREEHPVVQIAWEDAVAYAKWAGKRLPTEAEFEFAARGGMDRDRYAWGNELKPGGQCLYFNQIPENVDLDMKLIDEFGGPMTYPHYPLGWAMAGNTPFKRYKQETHAGGITDPMIVHWPKMIKDKGGLRSQYHHMIDITPTVLELLGIQQPRVVNGVDQRPMDGLSLAYTFNDAKAPTRRETQYYEMLGHRAIYYKGWEAVTMHVRGEDFDKDPWELYNVTEDFSESNDVAAQNPGKLRELLERWWSEAARYNVLPLDDRGIIRSLEQPAFNRPRTIVTYLPGMPAVPRANMLNLRNRSYSITADVDIPPSGAEGVLMSLGGRFGGFSFFVQKNRLSYAYNWVGLERFTVTSTEPVPTGPAKLRLEFTANGPGSGTAALVHQRQASRRREDRSPRSYNLRTKRGLDRRP